MNRLLSRPHESIFLAIPLILVLSVIGLNKAVDIQMHDTYLVIALTHIGLLFSIILGIIGFIYWLVRRKKLVNWMTFLHVIITISAFTLFMITVLVSTMSLTLGFAYLSLSTQISIVIILVAVLAKLIFVGNLVISLIRNQEKN